jgi:hypothetical protein
VVPCILRREDWCSRRTKERRPSLISDDLRTSDYLQIHPYRHPVCQSGGLKLSNWYKIYTYIRTYIYTP